MISSVFNLFKKEVLVIDMGAYNTKFVVGSFYRDEIVVKKMFMKRTPKELYKDGQILDINKMKGFIKKAIVENKIKCRYMALTFSGSSLITKDISIPNAGIEDSKNMLEFEIQQCFPIDINHYNIQYRLIGNHIEEGIIKSIFHVVALPREISDDYFELCNMLDLKPYTLDIHSNCINKIFDNKRIFNKTQNKYYKSIAVLDIGHDFTEVVLVDNGNYVFSRLVNSAGKDIDIIIANTFNLDMKEAEAKKIAIKNLVNDLELSSLDSTINEIIITGLNSIMQEIDKIFKFYLSRATGNKIDSIYICGGSSRLNGIDGVIEKYFNIPSFKIESISGIKLLEKKSLKGSLSDNQEDEICFYINTIGALIRR